MKLTFVFTAALFCLAPSLSAQVSGIYIGGGWVRQTFTTDNENVRNAFQAKGDCQGWYGRAGFVINTPIVAGIRPVVEIGYADISVDYYRVHIGQAAVGFSKSVLVEDIYFLFQLKGIYNRWLDRGEGLWRTDLQDFVSADISACFGYRGFYVTGSYQPGIGKALTHPSSFGEASYRGNAFTAGVIVFPARLGRK